LLTLLADALWYAKLTFASSSKGVVLDEHSDDPIEGDCLICGDEMTPEDASVSRCGHAFCNICWQGTFSRFSCSFLSTSFTYVIGTGYLELKINEGEALGVPCMMHKCGKVVDSNLVKRTVSYGHHVLVFFFLGSFEF
jgi:hypothetical protein